MKGVILAGGTGTRLFPLTKVTNKHLLPVGNEPMIFNPIKQLLSADITDILVVTSKEHMGDIVNLLGSGVDFGCTFTFKVQETAGGIAQALYLARGFVNDDNVIVILGDNILTHSIKPHVNAFIKHSSTSARILLKKVEGPERYGVAALDERNKMILEIEEKPKSPKSNYAVIGVYMYNPSVFKIIETLKPSDRGELEISDVNNEYVKRMELSYGIVRGDWTDAGTMESLQYANKLLFDIHNEIVVEDYHADSI
jgi:glucose-1-phosphate thymidylyltransferase